MIFHWIQIYHTHYSDLLNDEVYSTPTVQQSCPTFPFFIFEIRFMKLPAFPGCPGNPSAPGNPGNLYYYKNHIIIKLLHELRKILYFVEEVGGKYGCGCNGNKYYHYYHYLLLITTCN